MINLAIQGHATRGKEIIEILKMLGGVNKYGINASSDGMYSIRENDNAIISVYPTYKFVVFTLEEFLEKFPYRVGSKVIHSDYESLLEIVGMKWENDSIKYEVYTNDYGYWFSVDELQPYEETVNESINKTNKVVFEANAQSCDIMNDVIKENNKEKIDDIIGSTTEINLNHPCFGKCNEIELIIPAGWEFEQRGNKMFGVRKQYPKTYEECAKELGYNQVMPKDHILGYKGSLLSFFQQLLICRDAYWKIAGEQMGLGKPWKPDWTNNNEVKFTIGVSENEIIKCCGGVAQYISAFPTEEMRDAFFENFKYLIKQCKELL